MAKKALKKTNKVSKYTPPVVEDSYEEDDPFYNDFTDEDEFIYPDDTEAELVEMLEGRREDLENLHAEVFDELDLQRNKVYELEDEVESISNKIKSLNTVIDLINNVD